MHETCFTQTVSIQRLGEKDRTRKRPVHHKKALQIRMEDIRKSLHLALEEPRVAQYVNIDHLGVKGRNIFQNHGLLRNGLALGLATTDHQRPKIIGDGKGLARFTDMRFDAQLDLLSAPKPCLASVCAEDYSKFCTARWCEFRAITVHGLDVS